MSKCLVILGASYLDNARDFYKNKKHNYSNWWGTREISLRVTLRKLTKKC